MRTLRVFSELVVLIALSSAGPLAAQETTTPQLEAFGLRFGDALSTAKSKGLQLTVGDGRPGSLLPYSSIVGPFDCYPNVHKLPAHPTTTAWTQLCFSPAEGLQKLLWAGTGRVVDPQKRDRHEPIKQDYLSMKDLLEKKYGVHTKQAEPVAFQICLETPLAMAQYYASFDNCRAWHTTWNGEFGSVELEMIVFNRAFGRNDPNEQAGYVRLTYQGPRWESALKGYSAGDADAF